MSVTISREAAEAIKKDIDTHTSIGLTNSVERIIDSFVEEKLLEKSISKGNLKVGDWAWDKVHNRIVSLVEYNGKLGYEKISLAGSTIFYSVDDCIPIAEKFPVGSLIKDWRFGIGVIKEYGSDRVQYSGEFADGHILYGYIEHISEVKDSDWERTVGDTVFRAYQIGGGGRVLSCVEESYWWACNYKEGFFI